MAYSESSRAHVLQTSTGVNFVINGRRRLIKVSNCSEFHYQCKDVKKTVFLRRAKAVRAEARAHACARANF